MLVDMRLKCDAEVGCTVSILQRARMCVPVDWDLKCLSRASMMSLANLCLPKCHCSCDLLLWGFLLTPLPVVFPSSSLAGLDESDPSWSVKHHAPCELCLQFAGSHNTALL